MRDFKVGPGLDPASQMGPIVSAKQLSRLERLTESDPRYENEARLADGSFYAPTVILDRTEDKRLGHAEEIFGPVLIVKETEDADEGIRLANGLPLVGAAHGQRHR